MTYNVTDDSFVQEYSFPPVSPNAHRDHVGIFIQDTQRFSGGARLTAGIRYDYLSADAEDAVFTLTKTANTTTDTNVFSSKSDGAITASSAMFSSFINPQCKSESGYWIQGAGYIRALLDQRQQSNHCRQS